MAITASRLREDIYNILDRVVETGVPVEVVRKGKIVRITAEKAPAKRSRRAPGRRVMIGDPESFVHIDWLKEWSELK